VGTPCFEDGIGRRWRSFEPAGGEIETLALCPALAEAESTETALVERAARLAAFSHPAVAPVRRIERGAGTGSTLAIVSAAAPGVRLSEVLRNAQDRHVPPDLDAARFILAQVVTALADLHRHARDISHGAIGPERIVIGPNGRAVIVEPVLAPMLEQLLLARTPLWTEFRVPVPPVAGTVRFDQVTDVMQLGVLALALVLGRPLRRDEYPNRLHELMLEVSAPGEPADRQAVLRSLRAWIHRTLQLEPRSAFRTAAEAAPALEAVLAEGPRHKVSPSAVARYLAACGAETDSDWKVPSLLATPPGGDVGRPGVEADAGRVSASPRAAAGDAAHLRRAAPSVIPAPRRRSTGPGPGPRSPLVGTTEALSAGLAMTRDRSGGRKAAHVCILSLALVALFGVAYLSARGYLTLPREAVGRGTVVIESRPAGVEVFVDGLASGRTPATLDLQAGEHTVVLRAGRGITLVPVVAVAGARRVERVDIRQRPRALRAPAAAVPPTLPPQGVPQ
jgi:hypothetical protein